MSTQIYETTCKKFVVYDFGVKIVDPEDHDIEHTNGCFYLTASAGKNQSLLDGHISCIQQEAFKLKQKLTKRPSLSKYWEYRTCADENIMQEFCKVFNKTIRIYQLEFDVKGYKLQKGSSIMTAHGHESGDFPCKVDFYLGYVGMGVGHYVLMVPTVPEKELRSTYYFVQNGDDDDGWEKYDPKMLQSGIWEGEDNFNNDFDADTRSVWGAGAVRQVRRAKSAKKIKHVVLTVR